MLETSANNKTTRPRKRPSTPSYQGGWYPNCNKLLRTMTPSEGELLAWDGEFSARNENTVVTQPRYHVLNDSDNVRQVEYEWF